MDEGTFYDTNFAVYIRDRNKEVVYNGVTEYEELISFVYVDRTVYLNAEGFNIQPVKITNGYFFLQDIVALYKPAEETEETTETSPSNAPGFGGYAGFDPFAMLRIAPVGIEGATDVAYINLTLSPEGFVIGIGTAALFGVLKIIGG